MGRTVPTFRQLIDLTAARWTKFRRALRREDQRHFDRLFRRVRAHTQAATYQCHDNPMEAILLAIALDHEKRIEALERTVRLSREDGKEGEDQDDDATDRLDTRPLSNPARNGSVVD